MFQLYNTTSMTTIEIERILLLFVVLIGIIKIINNKYITALGLVLLSLGSIIDESLVYLNILVILIYVLNNRVYKKISNNDRGRWQMSKTDILYLSIGLLFINIVGLLEGNQVVNSIEGVIGLLVLNTLFFILFVYLTHAEKYNIN